MRTVVLGEQPPEVAALIERRRALGLDLYDEVWEGEYHMAPAPRPRHGAVDARVGVVLNRFAMERGLIDSSPFNLGEPDDFRVPDRGVHRTMPTGAYAASAALVVEVVSPHDESWEKLPFYAAHDVDEVVMVDPDSEVVTWLVREGDGYVPTERSEVLGCTVADFVAEISFPEP